ncbi:MAG: WD40 repeat domain-containing protein, partial [Gammaproteobacteria bacterium]|nr:WD40 repeat domain-containing protein [Gammaproteobacteria bacterium]
MAEKARGMEAQARSAAEYNAYVARLQLVQHNIARRDYVQARSNLWDTPAALRGPEWSILLNFAYPEKYLVQVDGAFVLHAKLSPDGRSIATANFGGPSRIYDVQSGEERLRFHEENDRPEAISWNPVSPQLMIADQSGIIWIWNTATGALQHRIGAHRGTISAAAYSPDGTEILSAGNDGAARLWDTLTGALIHEFDSAASIAEAAYAPIGPFFAFTSASGGISVYNRTEIGAPIKVSGHLFRFSPDGSILAAVDDGGVIHLRDLVAGADRPAPPALEAGVFALDFSPDGSLLAVAGADRRVLIWHVERGELVQTLTEPGYTLETAFLDNALFATYVDGNRLRVVDLLNGTPAYSRTAHGMHGNTLSVLGNGMAVSTGG